MMKTAVIFSALLIILALMPGQVRAAGEEIDWQVLSGGGNRASDGGNVLWHTVGQTATGFSTGAPVVLHQGFWQVFSVTPSFLCGDPNGDGLVNIKDVTYLINFLYKGGPPPQEMPAADVNGDGLVNIKDVTYMINFLYKGGPTPIC